MEIIPYHIGHQMECLKLFDSNEPTFFDKEERVYFKAYLKREKYSYWVLKEDEVLLACGGYEVEKPGDARIVWLMVDQRKHNNGFGRILMEHFEKLIVQEERFDKISLMTSQGVNKFYENLGYRTLKFEPKYWCNRFDLYFMEKELRK